MRFGCAWPAAHCSSQRDCGVRGKLWRGVQLQESLLGNRHARPVYDPVRRITRQVLKTVPLCSCLNLPEIRWSRECLFRPDPRRGRAILKAPPYPQQPPNPLLSTGNDVFDDAEEECRDVLPE